jgi:hypothetical protein
VTPFAVDYDPPPGPADQVIVSLAGPVWSLVMGAVLLVVARSWGTGSLDCSGSGWASWA